MRPIRHRWLLTAAITAAGACTSSGGPPPPAVEPRARPPARDPGAPPPVAPTPDAGPPGPMPPDTVVSHRDVSIGLVVGGGPTAIGGGAELVVTDPAGDWLAAIPEGTAYRIVPNGPSLSLLAADGTPVTRRQDILVIRPAVPGSAVRVDGRDYRGEARAFPDRTGLTVVNRLGLESYLAGVVPLEIGPRRPEEREAVLAQAVVSRTFAVRNAGRWRSEGFDFYPTVADQVYGGVAAETPLAWQAVLATRGEIVTYGRAPIDAFFYSTCGGRTADGTEVFSGADRPYLRSVDDADRSGRAYCRASPRFHWREEWSGARVTEILRGTLPRESSVPGGRVDAVRDIRVGKRSRSDRVVDLAVVLPRGTVTVRGAAVRRTLLRPNGELLRSAVFTLTGDHTGGGLRHLVAEGRGAGHGVGLCQWGAIGRAAAGHGYREILRAYFPGTQVETLE